MGNITGDMKFQLTEKDHLEEHHLYDLIYRYVEDHNGEQPEYVIVHPATYHKIIMLTNGMNHDFSYPVVQFDHREDRPKTTIYGIAFIRSSDVEEGFVIVT